LPSEGFSSVNFAPVTGSDAPDARSENGAKAGAFLLEERRRGEEARRREEGEAERREKEAQEERRESTPRRRRSREFADAIMLA